MQEPKEKTRPVRIRIKLLDAIEKEAITTSLEREKIVQIAELVDELLSKAIIDRDALRDKSKK